MAQLRKKALAGSQESRDLRFKMGDFKEDEEKCLLVLNS